MMPRTGLRLWKARAFGTALWKRLRWWLGLDLHVHAYVRLAPLHDCQQGNLLFETDETMGLGQWLLHPKFQNKAQVSFADSVLQFDVPARTRDEWAYLYLDPQRYRWRDVSWQLRFRRDTPFREYAFNFRYQDFNNRYRFRFEDESIQFDSKIRGVWRNNIARVPFPMTLGRWYALRIDMFRNTFRCYVDGVLKLECCDEALAEGSICIILWENDGDTDICASVGPMQVVALSAGSQAARVPRETGASTQR